MAIAPHLLPAIAVFHLFIISESTALIPQSSHISGEDHHRLIHEIHESELKITQLESILEESISKVKSKSLYIKETEKLIEEMASEVDHLQSVLLSIKNDSSRSNERINKLEEEVRILWATSRGNNFELHTLESKSEDAEKRLKKTTTRVETMAAIVNEQWIQIQHLDQALEIARRRTKEVKRQVSSTRCSFLMFVKSQFGDLLDEWWEMLERSWSAAKRNHHQVQRFVKKEMHKWEYTAAFANQEVVFFVASALITFPALTLGVFLLNNFS